MCTRDVSHRRALIHTFIHAKFRTFRHAIHIPHLEIAAEEESQQCDDSRVHSNIGEHIADRLSVFSTGQGSNELPNMGMQLCKFLNDNYFD